MTEHEASAPVVLTRARLAPLTPGGLPSSVEVRRRSDRRRRHQRTSGSAAVVVLAVSSAVLPWLGGDTGRDPVVAVGPDDRGRQVGHVTDEGLFFTLPDGWDVKPDSRRTCVGPVGAEGCPLEISVAPDPTVGDDDPLGNLVELLDDCPRGAYRNLMILSESVGTPPVSTYRGGCDRPRDDGPTKTIVSLDTNVASASTWDSALLEEARAIVASFVVPDGWLTEPPPELDEVEPSAAPSVS